MGFREITSAAEFPVIIHGTYFKNWNFIRNEGLKRCGRNHVHFAIGEVGNDGVVSGMRESAEVVIYLNMELALQGKCNFDRLMKYYLLIIV